MFDPTKLSPLPWSIVTASKSKRLRNVFCDALCMPLADKFAPDDAEFFVMARRCFDIGERRGWYVQNVGGRRWRANFNATNGDDPDERFHELVPTQAEAMALMIEADEWLTKQEMDGAK
jgi:hypothetical protein